MQDLVVTPNYLDKLATIDDQTSDKTASAAGVASGISTDLWVTHGVICEKSNRALTDAEAARRSLVEAMQSFAHQLALKLGTAADAYSSTDQEMAANIDKQIVAT